MTGKVTTLTLPRLGETMQEARVTDWLKAPGQAFKRGEMLLEVETDKTVVEVPALHDGVLLSQLVAPGEMVALDQPIAEVRLSGASATQEATTQAAAAKPGAAVRPEMVALPPAPVRAPDRPSASPRARALARKAGIDLAAVLGSGRRGRITGPDVAAQTGAATAGAAALGVLELLQSAKGPLALRRSGGTAATDLPPVLLLHGVFDDSRGWRDLPQRLARAGHLVLAVDLPGHGGSPAATDLASATDLVQAALAQLVPQGPVVLVGHSLGAVLTSALALRLGSRVARLVLLAPAGLGMRINDDFLAVMAGAQTPAALARGLRLLGAGPLSEPALQAEFDRLAQRRADMMPVAQALAVGGLQQTDIAPDLARLQVPVVAVFGLADQIIDWQDCAALPARAAIHLVRDAGHLPHSAAPDLVAQLVSTGAAATSGAAPIAKGA